ncbi:hypothetical protein PAHAL_6G020400 [Panicum hallii]|uniref:Uncharacterized protein n=1 Tax=Panicum hallii TaxID=206008 RepID=A0A2T8IEV5_9POAL|nr:hypothetical protein PAHAL_6G020400 [Panicum hallii]
MGKAHRLRWKRLEQLHISRGISPWKELLNRERKRRRRSWPTVRGTSPASMLESRLSSRRNVRLPIAGEIMPESCLDGMSSDATLPGCRRLHVTPAHWQTSELVLFHELSQPMGSESSSLTASRALRSPSATSCCKDA